ncbi:type II secretion system protein M [Vibrio algivorus]|uniref:Type II secretion system protein M n=1 Tax=Vibrio algivorus TaxID=1667024 RepID=A0A557PC85_9VIBR|nr:type II secretion system protein M [Vibrio algivorus]TVO38263.1 type II secretion system protein M [Vibrio algivorus]GLT13118.1 type II secretion system protein M [Vibrio algivorus]
MNDKLTALITPVLRWWHSISVREQRLVLVCCGLFAVGFLYWGILQPLSDRTEQAQMRLNNEKQLLGWVTQSANHIVTLRAQTGSKGVQRSQPLNQVVSSTATRFNIELIRMQPRDDMLQVWIQPVPFNNLINWLAQLRDQYGLQVLFLDINRSDKAGMVEVNRLQFQRG